MSFDAFSYFPPFIQNYIYKNGWETLRPVQIEAAKVIFETNNNLLLSSATASGKTEAAFFPILSSLYKSPSSSFGCIYIAPLKSLINDQFLRMDDVLRQADIPLFHWHGDVAASHKNTALKNPSGILQITPESLESMLINRSNDITRLFFDLRFIVIDEIHVLTGSDRGNQILCQLKRIQDKIGHIPRRIGLSATVGGISDTAKWLSSGTGRKTSTPVFTDTRTRWKLGVEHFYIQNTDSNQTDDPYEQTGLTVDTVSTVENVDLATSDKAMLDAGYEYIYDCTKEKKCLVFSNSREETEYVTATLRQIARYRGEKDRFFIHHGNLSASLREEAEMKLKDDEQNIVTCATVTMELGIDIGKLERIIHVDSPVSVMSLLQRIGRSGRRGEPPEMMMVFREENPLPNTPLPQLIPWSLIRAIAIIQLYIEERFIEPPNIKKMPFSLMFQQTLSVLASRGSLSAKALADIILELPPFSNVDKSDYKELLVSMLNNDFVEMTEEKELMVGLRGEKLVNSFKFYAVFKDSEDYTVRCDSDEIGTITTPPPVGDRFALAGRVWEVKELDIQRHLIYVKKVDGKMEIAWPGDYGEIHTRILERMKLVLEENTMYPYLKKNARKRLETARNVARKTGMLQHSLVHIGGYSWCLFPWLGTRSFRTLRKYIVHNSDPFGLSGLDYDGCYYMTFKLKSGDGKKLTEYWKNDISKNGIDRNALVSSSEAPVFEKYDGYIPANLLRKAYVEDKMLTGEIYKRIPEIYSEYL